MPKLTETQMRAFHAELEKVALSLANVHQALGGAGALGGIGAGAGALVGAVRGYQNGDATGEGHLMGALHGAGKGALMGGGIGALGGAALAHTSSPGEYTALMEHLHGTPVAGSFARAGQRTTHSVTGWTPRVGDPSSLRDIHAGSYHAEQRLEGARQALDQAGVGADLKRLHQNVLEAKKGLHASRNVEAMGLTSLPGTVRAIGQRGLPSVISADVANQWHSGGNVDKLLGFGLPAAFGSYELGHAVLDPETAPGQGPGKGEQYGKAIGNIAGGLVGSALPMPANMALGLGLGVAGEHAGKAIDRLRGRPAVESSAG